MKKPRKDFLIHMGTELDTGQAVYQSAFERARMAAAFGQIGSGKSEAVKYQTCQIIRAGHGILFLDSHRRSVESALDEVIRYGRPVTSRLLYFSSLHPEYAPMIEMLERCATEPVHRIAERDAIAKDFSQILVRTANQPPGEGSA